MSTLVETFDALKSKQRVRVAISACMGHGSAEGGVPTEYFVGRRGKGRFGETIALLPIDGRKPSPGSKIVLHKRRNCNGDLYVGAAIGDLGATVISIELA